MYRQHRSWLDMGRTVCVYSLNVRCGGWTRVDREDRGGWREGRGGVHVPFYSFEIDRLRTTLLAHTLAPSIHAVVRLHTVRIPRSLALSPSSSFYQFLSFSLSRGPLSQPASHSSAAFLGTRAEVLGRRIRVQPFHFDAALGTAGVKTCLCIATTIRRRTYKAAA